MTAQPLQFLKGEKIMAKITTGQSFNAGDQITSTKLNNIVGTAFLDSDSVTGTTLNLTSGQLKVATNGITDNELNANSVITAKIANDAVTYAKIQDVAASSVIGNTTASTATPGNVAILDEDNMVSNSATSLATQQSIKAYVDNQQSGTAITAGPTDISTANFTTAPNTNVTFAIVFCKPNSNNWNYSSQLNYFTGQASDFSYTGETEGFATSGAGDGGGRMLGTSNAIIPLFTNQAGNYGFYIEFTRMQVVQLRGYF